ncbi:MAG: hypothetical protein WDN04_09675 [Rhodospirillales bacterium]
MARWPTQPAWFFRAAVSGPTSPFCPTTQGFRRFAESADFGTLQGDDRLLALNTLLVEDGAVLDVAPGVDAGTLLLIHIGSDLNGAPASFHPRHAVRLAAGAALTLVDISAGQRYLPA